MKAAAAVVAGILCLGIGWLQPRGPDWLEFREVTVVRYYPGAQWGDFGKYAPDHLAFLRRQMEAGKLLYAGPFADDSGGLNIYSVADLEEVDRLVRQDPAVAHGAVTFSMQVWNMSKLAEKRPAPTVTQPAKEPPAETPPK